jgi:hypothetical protein
MKGKRIVIATPIAEEIQNIARINRIDTTDASKIVFLKWHKRSRRKSLWGVSMDEARDNYKFKKVANALVA